MPGTPLFEYGQQIGLIGDSVNDEENYLINISDRPASKYNYSNFSGKIFKDVIFWDYKIYYWAMKKFYSDYSFIDIVKKFLNEKNRKLKGTCREWKNPTRPLFYDSALFSKLSWKLICFIGKNTVYYMYLLKYYSRKIRKYLTNSNDVFVIQQSNLEKRVPPISKSFFQNNECSLNRSLRRIVKKNRAEHNSSNDKNKHILIKGF